MICDYGLNGAQRLVITRDWCQWERRQHDDKGIGRGRERPRVAPSISLE